MDGWDYGPGNVGDQGSWMSSWLPAGSDGGGSSGGFDSFLSALVKTGEVFASGIPRYIDARAGLVRAENSLPVVYRNGVPYPIDPDAYRYGQPGALGMGSNSLLLLGLVGVGLVLLLKD